jgi:hypothetical protein
MDNRPSPSADPSPDSATAWPTPGLAPPPVADRAPDTTATGPSSSTKTPTTDTKAARRNAAKDAAKDTTGAMFGEVRAAVKGASRREPYPYLALISTVGVVVWLIWREDEQFGAENLKLWTVFVIAGALLVFTPMVRSVIRFSEHRAWQFAVGGAAALGFAWVAFLLPVIQTNQAFFGTLATAAAGLAAWTAPGRPQ